MRFYLTFNTVIWIRFMRIFAERINRTKQGLSVCTWYFLRSIVYSSHKKRIVRIKIWTALYSKLIFYPKNVYDEFHIKIDMHWTRPPQIWMKFCTQTHFTYTNKTSFLENEFSKNCGRGKVSKYLKNYGNRYF